MFECKCRLSSHLRQSGGSTWNMTSGSTSNMCKRPATFVVRSPLQTVWSLWSLEWSARFFTLSVRMMSIKRNFACMHGIRKKL